MMKKYIIVWFVACAFALTGCESETEPGGTTVEKMAGDWWVTYQNSMEEYDYLFEETGAMPDESNIENWTWDYVYDDAYSRIYTFNTAANLPTEMFITDKGNYWDYKVKASVDYEGRAFTCPTTPNLAYEDCDITIIGGKILEGAATTPSGMPADSIVFYIRFGDDPEGFTYTKASGFRRTGFPADDF
jgi:hypothetical protein